MSMACEPKKTIQGRPAIPADCCLRYMKRGIAVHIMRCQALPTAYDLLSRLADRIPAKRRDQAEQATCCLLHTVCCAMSAAEVFC